MPKAKINDLILKDGDLKIDVKTGYVYSNPKFIAIESTNRCNLNCVICDRSYVREHGFTADDMYMKTFKRLIPFIKTSEHVFLSQSGEPLLSRNLMKFIKICKEYPCKVGIASNGLLLNEDVSEKLIDNGLDEIELSIDGIESFYKIRGFKVETFIKNIEKLNEIKEKKKNNNPSVIFTFVAMKDNLRELSEVINLAALLGVKKIFVHPLVIYYSCLKDQNIYRDRKTTLKILNQCKTQANKLGIDLVRRRISLLNDEGSRKSTKYICMEPFERFHVDWSGNANVICCGDKSICPEKGYMNVSNYSLQEIWNCKQYRKVRLEFLNKNLDESCQKCSLIFGSLKNQLKIFDPNYIPPSLKRFSSDLWKKNLGKRLTFQEKLLNKKKNLEEKFKKQAKLLKEKIALVIDLKVEKDNLERRLREKEKVIRDKERHLQIIFQSRFWRFLKVIKSLMIKAGMRKSLPSLIEKGILKTRPAVSPRRVNNLKKVIRKSLSICGIFDGSHAYIGPSTVQIDITNKCNNNCLYCWARSPLLGEKRASKQWESYELDFDLIKNLINDLCLLGTENIHVSGGGEPFMHPQIINILEYIKKKNMRCEITTNFTLVTEDIAERMVDLGLDLITVSLWAGTGKTYEKLHPNKSKEIFYQIKKILKLMSSIKKGRNKTRPLVRLCNVISNINYGEIEKMIDLAEATGSEMYLFQTMDPVPGYTEKLLLSDNERKGLIDRFNSLIKKMKNLALYCNINVCELDEFLRRISNKKASLGYYDEEVIEKIPCYVGWIFSRISADGNVNFCLKTDEYPIGNLYKQGFKEIWNSEQYRSFRKRMLRHLSDPDRPLRCERICDNRIDNLNIYFQLKELSVKQKAFLKILKGILKFKKILKG